MTGINPQLGGLGIKISIDDSGVPQKLKKTEGALRTSANATKKLTAASSRASRGLLELSRGAEDAAVGFGLNGFQGAMRGATNNLTQFAFIAGGPALGAIAGFVAAGVSMLPILFNIASGSKEATEGVEKLNTALDRLTKIRLGNLKFEREREGAHPDVRTALIKKQIRQGDLEDAEVRLKGTQEQRGAQIKEFAKTLIDLRFGGPQQATIDDILRQREIDSGKPGEEFRGLGRAGFAELQAQRKTVREDISIGNVKPEIIEKAIRSRAGSNVASEMNEFLTKTTDAESEATSTVLKLRRQVQLLTNDVEKFKQNRPNLDFLIEFNERMQKTEREADRKARKGVQPGEGPNLDFLIGADEIKQ